MKIIRKSWFNCKNIFEMLYQTKGDGLFFVAEWSVRLKKKFFSLRVSGECGGDFQRRNTADEDFFLNVFWKWNSD